MEKIIGYWIDDVYGEIPIIKKDDGKYYRRYTDIDEEFPKEMYQYSMTHPFGEMRFYYIEQDGEVTARYISPICDSFSCNIIGTGTNLNSAVLNLIENILDIMNGYNKEKVNKFMTEYKKS